MEYHIVGEDYGKCVELWVGKVIVHPKFNGLFHGNWKIKMLRAVQIVEA